MAKKEYPIETVAVIKSGIEQPFWKELKRIIKLNVDFLDKQILEDDDEELDTEIKTTKRALLRKWRNLNKELLKLPNEIIESIEEGGETRPTNYDPYERVNEAIRHG